MADSKREQRGHFRGKARPGRRVEVRWRQGETAEAVRGFTKNIGVGGAFILTTDPQPPGAQLQVAIVFDHAENKFLEVPAEVRWVLDGKSGTPTEEQGMGVRFATLEVEALVALTEYFATLTATLDLGEV